MLYSGADWLIKKLWVVAIPKHLCSSEIGAEYEKILVDCDCQLKDLISGLSRPFRHLETYPSMLNELERGMHEAHPDRGDTQRAAAVFRDIANYCTSLRKQKEMQLELLSSGSIDGLSSEAMKKLGEIIYMAIVSVDDVKASTDEGLFCDRSTFDKIFSVIFAKNDT
ncbi:unnamed protein product [Gongylonema pulchrum]|uniref:DH domain-containing protein n=1 Tax=Gongylonema pulchrum TaxID=637853 RepID=A0A183ETX8_9BILA|nr:unnamed protein product [Gongylonema pulchrum]